ncbi:MAG: FTR1 family protein [Rhodospirillaceae bacterium]|nr:FTR1 family protein [Rhodospirillaceae bacterium]
MKNGLGARLLRQSRILIFGLVLAFAGTPHGAAAQTAQVSAEVGAEVRQVWKLLDYLAVDYPGAVTDGKIVSDAEFAEMKEFSNTALARLTGLPAREGQQDLIKQAQALQSAIIALGSPADIARIAHGVADGLLAVYPVPLAPSKTPDLARGQALYAEHCAGCHGLQGRGDGEAGKGLEPAPIAFTDHERARARSLFSLYEVTTQGLADTPMIGFQERISEEDRWSVAYFISTFSAGNDVRAQGEKLWAEDTTLRAHLPNLESLTRILESDLAADVGSDKAYAVLSYLRGNPGAIVQDTAGGLALARAQLAESLKAYQTGDAKRAGTLALSSYLDGFEPLEPAVRGRDADLLARVESGMISYRSLINSHAPYDQVAAQAAVVNGLFNTAETVLLGAEDSLTTFLGAYTILVREGIEALLVVVAMLAFLGKVERHDVLPYVHGGWIGALAAGVVTWALAVYVVDISGANRELTEGFAALFAAVILLGVGIWMHQKSLAGRWQTYIKEKLSTALTKKSAWFLFTLAFVAVYREVFETILFYVALWTRGNGAAILGGFAAGAVTLVVLTIILMRTSRRLPIGQFFAWSSLLIGILAFVLAGKGFAALQEAGVVPAIVVDAPRIELLGVYPSMWPLLAQAAVLVVAVAGYFWNTRGTAADAQAS